MRSLEIVPAVYKNKSGPLQEMKKSVFVIEDSEEDEEDATPIEEEERGPLADTDVSQRALKEEEQKCLLPIASPRGCNCCGYCVLM